MIAILNLLLKYTWKSTLGIKLKYKLKKFNYQFKKVSWSVMIYKTTDNFQDKNWKRSIAFNWFSLKNKSFYKEVSGFADPFLIDNNDKLFLFYEAIVNSKGEIWSAEIVNNKLKSIQKVISESFHLSYPNVFEYQEHCYMIPESSEDKTVRLYKALVFPSKWEVCKILYKDSRLVDTNFLKLENVYYWFTFDLDLNLTRLFYSYSIFSEWIEHKQSPLISNRNAGNFIFEGDQIFRPVQISKKHYGEGVKLMKIVELNEQKFLEEDYIVPFLSSESGYNLDGTHHISVVKSKKETIIAVDGKNNNFYQIINK
ncbi:hypothetical protein [Flavobacterium sp.]|uniref:glucosamine inositolphosphorylceramide transferase family protein n=1 Tax=Flavobacterium sp. TaxID=239 RepID=UPI00374DDFF5